MVDALNKLTMLNDLINQDFLENFDVHLCNVIGQLLDSNALRVLWISTYRVRVLRELSY